MLDIYDSIDYVVPFLLENNFIRTSPDSGNYNNKNFNISIIIRHNGYLLLENERYCMYRVYDFLKRIKQLLGNETQFKKVQND